MIISIKWFYWTTHSSSSSSLSPGSARTQLRNDSKMIQKPNCVLSEWRGFFHTVWRVKWVEKQLRLSDLMAGWSIASVTHLSQRLPEKKSLELKNPTTAVQKKIQQILSFEIKFCRLSHFFLTKPKSSLDVAEPIFLEMETVTLSKVSELTRLVNSGTSVEKCKPAVLSKRAALRTSTQLPLTPTCSPIRTDLNTLLRSMAASPC